MARTDLEGWPKLWPPPDVFFGPLAGSITCLHSRSLLVEYQIIVRFKNRYGVKILQSRLHEGLYGVTALRFYGSKLEEHDLVYDSHVPDLTWCFTSEEVFMLCEEVALWKSK
jgi:hypothetical protein